MKLIRTITYSAILTSFLLGAGSANATLFFEGFDDDLAAMRNIPDLADVNLSSTFSPIDTLIYGQPVMRTGGGPNGAFLDFYNGGGSILTLKFSTPFVAGNGLINFDTTFGSDGGDLFKYVSNDGINFIQVGDSSDALGPHSYNLLGGGTDTYFRLQVGNTNGIYDGIHVDNFHARVTIVPEPAGVSLLGLALLGLFGIRKRESLMDLKTNKNTGAL